MLVGAVVLFFTASHLAQNTFFHYTTGISLGVVGSLLIVVYVVARMVPKVSVVLRWSGEYVWQRDGLDVITFLGDNNIEK